MKNKYSPTALVYAMRALQYLVCSLCGFACSGSLDVPQYKPFVAGSTTDILMQVRIDRQASYGFFLAYQHTKEKSHTREAFYDLFSSKGPNLNIDPDKGNYIRATILIFNDKGELISKRINIDGIVHSGESDKINVGFSNQVLDPGKYFFYVTDIDMSDNYKAYINAYGVSHFYLGK